MALNFARAGDNEITEHLQAIDAIGATVVVQTTEQSDMKGALIRVATITWHTHNTDGRLLA